MLKNKNTFCWDAVTTLLKLFKQGGANKKIIAVKHNHSNDKIKVKMVTGFSFLGP